jgi:uncharacterized protein
VPEPASEPGTELVDVLVRFGHALRASGLPVGTGDLQTLVAATATLDPGDLLDLYFAGRATLVTRRDQLPTYHRVFCEFFLGERPATGPVPFTPQQRADAMSVLTIPETDPGQGTASQEQEAELGLVASDAATLKNKAFSACTPEELLALRRLMRTIRLNPPRRRTRRTERGDGRRPDLRRTVRETLRAHGEPARLFWRRRRQRPRPLTLILDVSGSMADY